MTFRITRSGVGPERQGRPEPSLLPDGLLINQFSSGPCFGKIIVNISGSKIRIVTQFQGRCGKIRVFRNDGRIGGKPAAAEAFQGLFADTGKKIYELYDDINLYNTSEKMRFYASALKWNGRTEQLTSGRGDMVKIEKDDTIMRGSGFTASGISKTFSFRGNITGTIETSENSSEESKESENVE